MSNCSGDYYSYSLDNGCSCSSGTECSSGQCFGWVPPYHCGSYKDYVIYSLEATAIAVAVVIVMIGVIILGAYIYNQISE